MLAPQQIAPAVHATVFKAANCNIRLDDRSNRANALMDRWLNAERNVRETVRAAACIEAAPEHLY